MVENMNKRKSLPGKPVIFGEVLFDVFPEEGNMVLGGAPFNVAWNLQAMGLAPHLVSRIGRDELGNTHSERHGELGPGSFRHPAG